LKNTKTQFIQLISLYAFSPYINLKCTLFIRTFAQKIDSKLFRMKSTEKARFDTRITKEQKEFFEYAASLGGFRTLTEFVVSALQEKAKMIVEDHNAILTSARDKEIFFKAIMNPEKPNKKLKSAVIHFEKALGK
jgi:uncharacterized protein (DUF1778 family)